MLAQKAGTACGRESRYEKVVSRPIGEDVGKNEPVTGRERAEIAGLD